MAGPVIAVKSQNIGSKYIQCLISFICLYDIFSLADYLFHQFRIVNEKADLRGSHQQIGGSMFVVQSVSIRENAHKSAVNYPVPQAKGKQLEQWQEPPVSEDPDRVEKTNWIYDDRKANAPCFEVILEEIKNWPRDKGNCDREHNTQHGHHGQVLEIKNEIEALS
jgi:hypothetical protein